MHRRRIPEFLRGLFGPTLIVYFLIIFFLGMLPGIDFWGHLGGAIGGAAMGLVLPSRIGAPAGDLPRVRWVVWPFALSVASVALALAFMIPRAVAYSGDTAREAIRAFDAAHESGRLEDAAAALDRAEAAEPDSPWIQAQREVLANFAMIEEDWALASRLLIQVDASDTEHFDGRPSAQNNYAWSLFMSDPGDAALRARGLDLARTALQKRQDDPVILNTLAWGLFLDGDYHGALATIEQAMQRNRGKHLDADVYIYVAALRALGRSQEAVETYREAVSSFPDGVLRREVAVLLARWEDEELDHDQILEIVAAVSGADEVRRSGDGAYDRPVASGGRRATAAGAGVGTGEAPGAGGRADPDDGGEPATGPSPGPADVHGDSGSTDRGWRPPRAQHESSRQDVQ